jgi:hypothetical protein
MKMAKKETKEKEKTETEQQTQVQMAPSLDEQIIQLNEAERRAKALFMETGDKQAISMIQQIQQHKTALQQQKTQMEYELQLAERNRKIAEERQRLFEQLGYNPNNLNMDKGMVEFTNQRPPISLTMPTIIPEPTNASPVPSSNPSNVLPSFVQSGQPIQKEGFFKKITNKYSVYLNLAIPVVVFILAIAVIYLFLR